MLLTESTPNRIYGLDILRAAAIFFVVYWHGADYFFTHLPFQTLFIPVFDGVSIFFVLSGFLIGRILIQSTANNTMSVVKLMRFWKRRWYRTLPNYFLILIILAFYGLLFQNMDLSSILKHALFIQNFNTPNPNFFAEAWSLSIEEWFYLIIPMALFTLLHSGIRTKHAIPLLAMAIIALSLAIRYYKYTTIGLVTMPMWDKIFRMEVISGLDGIMYGVIGAYLAFYHNNGWLKHKKPLLIGGITLLILHKLIFSAFIYYHWSLNSYFCVYSFSLSSIGTLLLLPFLSTYNSKQKGGLYRIITTISIISYSMYLVNYSLVHGILIPFLEGVISPVIHGIWLAVTKSLLYWSSTIFISLLIYKYYEAPITKLRDRQVNRSQLAEPTQ